MENLFGIGIHHIALHVSDLNRSLAFYCEGLGFRLYRRWKNGESENALVDFGQGYLELFSPAPDRGHLPAAGVSPHFAFAAEDVSACFERAVKAGAGIKRELTDLVIPSEPPLPITVAFVTGPDGETIEFFKEKK